MNIVQLQEQLKNFSQDQLVKEMQMPSGSAPQFLVLGEIMRRQKMQQDFSAQQAKEQPQTTVAEDAIAAAGVPQGGIASMARSLAPKTDMAESTGVQAMATGGPVKKMQAGDFVMTDPAIIAAANEAGMSVEEYLRLSEAEKQRAQGNQSFTLPEAIEENLGITFSLDGTAPTGPISPRGVIPLGTPETAATETEGLTGPDFERQGRNPGGAPPPVLETAPPEEPPAPPGGGETGGVAGISRVSPYEQELIDALKRREKAAEQDKWLALAQVGLNLMSSTQPTLAGALGEAGLKGVEAARTARDQYDKDRLELTGNLEQLRMSRAAATAKAARGGGGGAASTGGIADLELSAGQGRLLTQISADIDSLSAIVNDPYLRGAIAEGTATPEEELAYKDAANELAAVRATRRALLYGVMPTDGAGDDTNINAADE